MSHSQGIVVSVFKQRGFSFVQDDNSGEELFLHHSDYPDGQLPPVGLRIEYDIIPFRGRTKVANLVVIKPGVRA